MTRYTKHFQTEATPQSDAIPGSAQVPNSAEGYAWNVDDWALLDRFLILGTETPTYYATAKALTIKSGEAAMRCLASNGLRLVRRVVEISEAGRAPKNDSAIFVLAMAAKKGDAGTRKAAFEALPRVCRIGTHLFQFVEAAEAFGGWSRGLRRAVGRWYTEKETDALAYQLIKYRQRGGWTHRDVLRLAKPAAGVVPALKWTVGKPTQNLPQLIKGFQRVQATESASEVVQILSAYPDLPWEAIPSDHLKHAKVWDALLPNLPMTALIRNLARMTACGSLGDMSHGTGIVLSRLTDAERIKKARLHPIAILGALCTYQQGKGVKGNLTWSPVRAIMDALDQAFYLAFGNVEPSGKRTVLALDVSASMGYEKIASIPGLTPCVASAAMAMVTARTEKNYAVVAFCHDLTPLDISPRQRLDNIVRAVEKLSWGATDCALPMIWALKNKVEADTFIVYTDNETWFGEIHPAQALVEYRKKTGINAKLIVVSMVANEFSIADPNDAGMLDVVGFDTAAPALISDFSAGKP